MDKYNNQKYSTVRDYIKNHFKKYKDKDLTLKLNTETEDKFDIIFNYLNETEDWGVIKEDWEHLVNLEWESYQYFQPIIRNKSKGSIFTIGEVNKFPIPTSKFSSWQNFKKKSLEEKNGFDDETINNIERDVHRIINNVSINTENHEPRKGLVMGGVQSGKTTNIAGLIAMGADLGFNVFIVLSGTIESLRIQTEERIQYLLEGTSKKRDWFKVNPINKPKNHLHEIYRDTRNLYMVVLKNKTRLEYLIDWLQEKRNAHKLRVLVIDDEADQASVNTSKDPETDRKTINRLILNLIHNKDKFDKENDFKFEGINYIGYTATPYANMLSESPDSSESLFPRHFISTLTESKSHFGPKEIFGLLEEEMDELPIINEINNTKEVVDLLNERAYKIPIELKESIAYFISGAASLRKHNFNKPVSMLIHVSNRIDHHDIIYKSVANWLKNEQENVLEIAKLVWEREKEAVKAKDISKRVKIDKNRTLKPHDFNDIEDAIKEIISEIKPIEKDPSNKLVYHNGIHTIVDHSRSFGKDYEEFRLSYPTHKEDLKKTPIFLVIGGATLSRGITLEGLISTYFLRTPSAADTLTQMGRWFGYRINYELYPRIWITRKTYSQFKYISTLENDLREEIEDMNLRGEDFSQVAPRLLSMPQYISITSRNKSHAMEQAEFDFSGYSAQTYIFDNIDEIQKHNEIVTEEFINYLGQPIVYGDDKSSKIHWKNIEFNKIKNKLLDKFHFNERIKHFKNIDQLIEWIEEATMQGALENWNVILGGLGKINEEGNNWILDNFTYNMVTRTRKKKFDYDDINIGVLRNPNDMFADIDESNINDPDVIEILQDSSSRGIRSNYSFVREKLGFGKTPQLIIYKIDKKSEPSTNAKDRAELGINNDIIGLYITIPGRKKNDKPIRVTTRINNVYDEEDDFDVK